MTGELARQLHFSEAKAIVTMPTMLPTVTQAIQSNEDVERNIKVRPLYLDLINEHASLNHILNPLYSDLLSHLF